MSEPVLSPRNPLYGLGIVWGAVLIGGIAVGIFVEPEWHARALVIAFGCAIILSFAVQLWQGLAKGFIVRVAASTVGSLLLLAVLSAALGLIALFSP